MSAEEGPLADWLRRLSALLPKGEAERVLPEIEGLVRDRVEAERSAAPDISQVEAERRALAGWDSPEDLADDLVSAPVRVDLATRRSYLRLLLIVYAIHLVLSIVLTVGGDGASAVPGFLGPLPSEPVGALIAGALSLFFLDAGILLFVFVILGRGRTRRAAEGADIERPPTTREAILGLVFVGLMAFIGLFFLDQIFALRTAEGLEPFLSADLKTLAPLLALVLGLFAVRWILVLAGRALRPETVIVDALAALGATILSLLAATRTELITLPAAAFGEARAAVVDDLLERVFLVVFVLAALLFAVRFVLKGLRAWRLFGH